MKRVVSLMIAAAGTSMFISCSDAEVPSDLNNLLDSIGTTIEEVVEPVNDIMDSASAVIDSMAGDSALPETSDLIDDVTTAVETM